MARDKEKVQVIAVSALSTILFARNAFPPECFQPLPRDAIASSYDELMNPEGPRLRNNKVAAINGSDIVFLRHHDHGPLKSLLFLLESDILPMLETDSIRKLQLCIFETENCDPSSLHEVYELDFFTKRNGKASIQITFSGQMDGVEHFAVVMPQDSPQGLGAFLSRLPPLKASMYNAIFACVDGKKKFQLLGPNWKPDFDASQVKRGNLNFTKCPIATIYVDPKPSPDDVGNTPNTELAQTNNEYQDSSEECIARSLQQCSETSNSKSKPGASEKQPQLTLATGATSIKDETLTNMTPVTHPASSEHDIEEEKHDPTTKTTPRSNAYNNSLLDEYFSSPLASPV